MMMGLFNRAAGGVMRATAAWAVALALVTAGCGGSDKGGKQASAEAKKKPAKKDKPKAPEEVTVLSVDCAAAAAAAPPTYELPKIAEAADLRAPATEGALQLSAGPMLGAVADQSVKLWLRMDRPAPWRVTVWATKGPNKKKRVIEGALPAQEHDFTATLDIGELKPATPYAYQVELGAPGKDAIKLPQQAFRTLAAAGTPSKLRFAVGGQISGDMDSKIFAQIAQTKPDFLVLLGDLIYADDLEANFGAYAGKYASNWNIPELKELTQSVPAFMIWDDREIKKHYFGGSSTKRYQPARLAYELYAQAHNPTPTLPGALHYQFRAGDVSFFVLDVRSHRRDPNDDNGPKKTMLGTAQKTELARFLKCDPGKVKVVVSPVMFAGPARGKQAWTAYKDERDQLLSFIDAEKVDNVIVLSGDQQWSALLKHDRSKTRIYEFLTTPLSKELGMAPLKESTSIIARDDDHHVFGVVDIDTTATPATIAFTLCARGKPCKPGDEPAPTTSLDLEGDKENVPFTVKITDDELGLKAEAPAKLPDEKPAPAATNEAAKAPAPK